MSAQASSSHNTLHKGIQTHQKRSFIATFHLFILPSTLLLIHMMLGRHYLPLLSPIFSRYAFCASNRNVHLLTCASGRRGEAGRASRSISFASSDVLSFCTQPSRWAYARRSSEEKIIRNKVGHEKKIEQDEVCGVYGHLCWVFTSFYRRLM